MPLIWIIIFSLLGSVGLILFAGILLLFREENQKTIIPLLVSFATGTLLSSAFIGLIPHSLEHLPARTALLTVLIGILTFFLLEKIVIWRHCHKEHCPRHKATGSMILIGDAFHNLVDGVVIAASFIISIPLGIATSLAVIAHEFPQEIGDFGILLHSGYSKKKAFLYNLLSSLATLPAAIIAYFALNLSQVAVPYIMAVSAASFIYIALSDISPELQEKSGLKNTILQLLFIGMGVAVIIFVLQLKH